MAKKQSQTQLVLEILEKTIDGFVKLKDFMYNSSAYAQGLDRPLKKSSLSQAIHRLRTKGLIKMEKWNGELILRLSDEGKSKLVMERALRDEPWDGKWRVVFFDIPEQHSKARRILRARLKQWEFEPWQRSVWASKKNVTQILRRFIREIGAEKWVKVIEATDVG